MEATRRLSAGERSPDFVLAGPEGRPAHFYALAGGRPVALVLGDETGARHREITTQLDSRSDVDVLAVDGDAAAEVFGVARGESVVIVLDPNLRVVAELSASQPAADVVALLCTLAPAPTSMQVSEQAPVLFIPRVLDRTHCERLIEVWHRSGDVETGVERVAQGVSGSQLDASFKRRRDHTVVEPGLLRELTMTVGRRVMPEVAKAFAFQARRFEGFKIACYDAASKGFFRPHRDNVSTSTAHRVFALSLNLNNDYEGGQLRFSEYGQQLYRPEAGAALVFSCSHLHEVCEVTSGRRFVLLSFLYTGPAAPSSAPERA